MAQVFETLEVRVDTSAMKEFAAAAEQAAVAADVYAGAVHRLAAATAALQGLNASGIVSVIERQKARSAT